MWQNLPARNHRRGLARFTWLVSWVVFSAGCCLLPVGCGGGDDDDAPPQTSELVPSQLDETATATTGTGGMVIGGGPAATGLDTSQAGLTDLDAAGGQDRIPVGQEPVSTGTAPPQPEPPAARQTPADSEKLPPSAGRTRSDFLGPYCLQMGSFKSRNRAEQLAVELRNAGYAVEIVEATVGGILYHRVYLPNLPTRSDAEQLGERLKRSHGHDYLVRKID